MTAVRVQGVDAEFDDPILCGGCQEPWDRGFFNPEKWGGDGKLYCWRCYHVLPPGDFVDAIVSSLHED